MITLFMFGVFMIAAGVVGFIGAAVAYAVQKTFECIITFFRRRRSKKAARITAKRKAHEAARR